MHLGRRPSRLPEEIAGDARRYGPAEAWQRTVNQALDDKIDLVVLAGDVVEQDDDFYEAYRDLHAGVARLASAGIAVVGVSGNHDVHVLPRLAREIDEFELLGANGTWETYAFNRDGTSLTLHGWSFPRRHVTQSPLTDKTLQPAPGINLGLLHCDRDQPQSRYAPVRSSELDRAGLDGWLLGHIHKPDRLTAEALSGYLGSLTGLHPGEQGIRGPWLIEISGHRIDQVSQWPLAPLEWQPVELDLTGIETLAAAQDRLHRALRALDEELEDRRQPPGALGLRISLTGRTRMGQEVACSMRKPENVSTTGKRFAFVESVRVSTRPAADLEALIEQQAGRYPALLARRLLQIDRPPGDPERMQLIDAARRQVEIALESWPSQGLPPAALDDEVVATWLRDVGTRLLDDLEDQRRGDSPS